MKKYNLSFPPGRSKLVHFYSLIALSILTFFSACQSKKETYTRGIGVYPGNPEEDASPELVAAPDNYRNLAKNRAAYHSSSYDYNLTAQLITDGIIDTEEPNWISISTNTGVLPKNEREYLLDHNVVTTINLEGNEAWLQFEIAGGSVIPEISEIDLIGMLASDKSKSGKWQFVCSASDDGENWTVLDEKQGSSMSGQAMCNADEAKLSISNLERMLEGQKKIITSFNFAPASHRYYRLKLSAPSAEKWTITDLDFFNNQKKVEMAPSHYFKSAWMSSGQKDEWVYLDLGAVCSIDKFNLYWIKKAAKGQIQVSDNLSNGWTDVTSFDSDELSNEIKLDSPVDGRYVRVNMETAPGEKIILSELEVFGKGGLIPTPKAAPTSTSNSNLSLTRGEWKLQRASEVEGTGAAISQKDFDDSSWIPATVPGTVLTSYVNIGALPDPNYSDNQLMISESFFYSDFWYRNEFEVPANFKNDKLFLNFDGINWKADVFVNGKNAGKIEGAFIHGKFDVTDLITPGQKNSLAVLIHKNDNPGVIKEQTQKTPDKNGGILGADNPTFHASIGWDWIPTIRGRNIGIWNDVFLSTVGPVSIEDPFVSTDLALPDTSAADINVEVSLRNNSSENIEGVLKGNYGDIAFEKNISLKANEVKSVELNPSNCPSLHFENPKLWWPKGYGSPNLYDVNLKFEVGGTVTDSKEFKSGVREMSYTEENGILSLFINGRRFIGRGGNWGFSESNLNYRSREYDIAVAYHADMNFTLIRNWVGQIGDDELYEACDKYGVMIWQDFWLANPWDGPDPDNDGMFMENATDMVKRIRNHPSIAIYCGRNEGNPPMSLDTALNNLVSNQHPGLHYISHSSRGVVSGEGPYRALPVKTYYTINGLDKFHSERGMPNVMTYESLKQTLPDSALWPQNRLWGVHDYCLEGAQGAASFNQIIEKAFGKANDAQEFTELAQWINYEGYRGMFEARSQYRKGLLLWMSHSAWPSMVWQTYDYYFEPTAAYFGVKKACEPIHIQWNPVTDEIEVVNNYGRDRTGLAVKAELINMDGAIVWESDSTIDSDEDSTEKCFKLEFPANLSEVHFIKLTLTDGDKVISDNFYWRSLEEGNYQALNNLPKVNLENSTTVSKSNEAWSLTTILKNTSDTPALMVRLNVVGTKSGERILPTFYSDNYVSLMPGEEKEITVNLKNEDTNGEEPKVEITGFNIAQK
ncbi:glycosyl hydrolase 2 galactose-binding domain-containing protein [Mangrovibacterium diazotrophicum]|uniref:Glycosyl hydrolase family 2 n=1 Tax=Mangrovibacterium diazotrophicum TaxID=1261403 RepID=A0A419W4J8_9BACT|nr:discoidin domain-containing protein [Mangrovibacterium diazotrophicum]RKD90375.1 glycosyl hydrolase family 2 [Mangrovibacterium diazotrophicum]